MASSTNYWSQDAAAAPHDPASWENDVPAIKQVYRDDYKKKVDGKKKDRSKKGGAKKSPPYKQQSFPDFDEEDTVAMSPFRERLNLYANGVVSHDILKHVERLTALGVALRGQSNTPGIVATIVLYTQTYYDGSCVLFVKEFLEEYLAMEEQADFQWLDILRGAHKNWQMVVRSSSFKKISAIISVCTALGLVQQTGLSLTREGLKTVVKSMAPIHFGAIDMVDAVLGTVTHFVEKAFLLFKTRNWRSVFMDNQEELEFDNEFTMLLKMNDYALTGDLEKKFQTTDDQFADRLNALLDKARTAYQSLPSGFEKKVYYERYLKLQNMGTTFDTRRNHGGLREAPLGICLYGKSSVGKSTAVNIINVAIMKCFDIGGKEHIVTLNEKDKFESNMRSNIKSVILDDVANSKAQFSTTDPGERIIRYVNNIINTAVMAEADMKGKVFIRPKLFFATTNVKDLGASLYSNEPITVVRRMHLVITVKVREQYRLNIDGVESTMLDTTKLPIGGKIVEDVWLFDVERAIGVDDTGKGDIKPQIVRYVPYKFEGKPAYDIDIYTLIRMCNFHYRLHEINQKRVVHQANNMFDTLVVCKGCFNIEDKCSCIKICTAIPVDTVTESDASRSTTGSLEPLEKQAFSDYVPASIKRGIMMHEAGVGRVHFFFIRKYTRFWRMFRVFRHNRPFMDRIKVPIYLTGGSVAVAVVGSFTHFCYPGWFIAWYFAMCLYDRCCSDFEGVLGRLALLPNLYSLFKRREMSLMQKAVMGGVVMTGLYSLCSIWRATRRYEKQGNLAPACEEDVEIRDSEESDWAKVRVEPIPAAHETTTITESQLETLVKKNLCHVTTEGGSVMNALFIKSNLALIPGHILDPHPTRKVKDELIGTFVRYHDSFTRGAWQARLSRVYSYKIPHVDVRVVWVPNSPSFRDLTKYLSEAPVRGMLGKVIRKDEDASCKISSVRVRPNADEFGYDYTLDYDTFVGLCGAPLLGASKNNLILGIHTAGRTGLPEGRASCITRGDIDLAFKTLLDVPGFCPAASEGTMEPVVYDKQTLVSTVVHPKSPTNFLDRGTTVQVYGQCNGRATAVSSVVPTIISASVAEVTGVPRLHGPPKFRGPDGRQPWHPWRESLNKSGRTTIGVPGRVLVRAVEDYQGPLLSLLDKQGWWRNELMPLNRVQNVSGIDGKKFMNAIVPQTSVGFPLSGLKSQYMIDLDPALYPSHQCPRNVDEMFWDESMRMERKYLLGERAYPIFKGCLKDEPTKLTKTKVRVFQAAPLAYQLLIRKYYLPIARFMSCNPLISECAVGINAIGPEWDQLTQHIKRFGEDYILAGDYSNYDLTMSPQLMFAAFSVMIRLAKHAGYQPVCLKVMQSLATDICYPVVAYNGDLVELLGSNPSGQNLTVYINSIVNSLLFRAGYFTLCGLRAPDFRTRVALITYGDDAKSSVHEDMRANFDHIKFAKFLEGVGMVFTMPDKNSEATPFMTDLDADLLKRKNVYMPELGHWVGALDEGSIFKSLHCSMQSKFLSPKEQAVQNIDTAISDWFYHGREVYETRLRQMREVATRMDLQLLCTNLDKSFDYWVVRWRNKYLGEDEEFPPPDQGWG